MFASILASQGSTSSRSASSRSASRIADRALYLVAVLALAMTAMLAGVTASPAYAAASADDVAKWYEESAQAVVLSHAAKDLPDVGTQELASLTLGTPMNVSAVLSSDATSMPEIAPSSYWVASVNSSGKMVAVFISDFSSGTSKSEVVSTDETLLSTFTNVESGRVQASALVYDPKLDVWLVVDGNSAVPADVNASQIIAGSVPVEAFLAQRERNLGHLSPERSSELNDRNVPAVSHEFSPVAVAVAVLTVVALITGSVLWLRWESHHPEGRVVQSVGNTGTDSAEGSFSMVEDDAQSAKLSKSSGKVRVYRRAQSGNTEELAPRKVLAAESQQASSNDTYVVRASTVEE